MEQTVRIQRQFDPVLPVPALVAGVVAECVLAGADGAAEAAACA